MRKLRVLMLVCDGYTPPDTLEGCDEKQIARWKPEFDVKTALEELGHEVRPVEVFDDLGPIRESIRSWSPHVAFMMLEDFYGVVTYDHAIISYLELMQQPYTGCNAMGLMLTKDKAICKKILTYHRIPTPRFAVFPRGKPIKLTRRMVFPLIVKSLVQDGSVGIAQASLVNDEASLVERVKFIHDHIESDAITEHYIEGRELYVGVLGNHRLQTFPVWELDFSKMRDDSAPIATSKVKWDEKYQKRHGIENCPAENLSDKQRDDIARLCKRVYRALNMSGYARMDLRLRPDGRVFVIEANANPDLEYGEAFSDSAEAIGISYHQLLTRIINLGLRFDYAWKG